MTWIYGVEITVDSQREIKLSIPSVAVLVVIDKDITGIGLKAQIIENF